MSRKKIKSKGNSRKIKTFTGGIRTRGRKIDGKCVASILIVAAIFGIDLILELV